MELEATINRVAKNLARIAEVVNITLSTRNRLLVRRIVLFFVIKLTSVNSTSQGFINTNCKFVEHLLTFVLLQKMIDNGRIREVIHHQNTGTDLMIFRIKIHQAMHDAMILVEAGVCA
ncbi:unnamed protein product [Amaranthus hypochondriacus]